MKSQKSNTQSAIKANILELRITGRIWHGDTANGIRWYVDDALYNGIESVSIYLNTEGGSVFEATEIVNQLKRMKQVDVYAGALVASAGTYILANFPANGYTTSQFMIHKPHMGAQGNEDEIKAELKALQNLTKQYRAIYAQRFNMTEDEIEELWKQDYWMDASEALAKGLITKIIEEEIQYDPETLAMMQACGYPKISELTNNSNTMNRNQIIASLGLAADATDEQIQATLTEIKGKAATADSLKASSETEKKTKAEALVNKGILDKKITADLKDTYVSLAVADYDKTEKIINAMAVPVAGSQYVNKDASKTDATDRSNWQLEDYLENDPEAFETLMIENPAKGKELNAAYQRKNK
jgi:ATP-dependent Clp protease protease subunit